MIDQAINKAAGLVEALSYIQRFHEKGVVVKVGGPIMDDEQALSNILTDIVFMNYVGMQPVLVHGGGKAITQAMETAGLTTPARTSGPAGAQPNATPSPAAAARAPSMRAAQPIGGSDAHGIRKDQNDPETRISHLTVNQIDEMVTSGIITSGMLPKVEACMT